MSFLKRILRWLSAKYLFNHNYADFEVNNKKMLLDLGTDGISRALALYKTRERDKVFLINQLNLKGKTVLDLGANIGYYSLILSDRVGKNGSVFCVEPDPRNVRLLKANCALFGSENIKSINQIALSEKDGTIDLFLSGKSNLSTLIRNIGDNFNKSKVKVNCLKYKTFVKSFNLEKLELVRMDIEGYEQFLIPQILETTPNCNILFEVHSVNYEEKFKTFLHSISKKYKLEYVISTQGGRKIMQDKFNLKAISRIKSDKRSRYLYKNVDSKIMPELICHEPRIIRYALIKKKNK